MPGKGEIEGVNDCGFGNDRGVVIIGGSIDEIIARKSVSRGEFSTGEDFPNDVKVL